MKNLLPPADLRRINLIEYLYFYGNTVKKNDALEVLSTKESNLRSDIEVINNLCDDLLNVSLNGDYLNLNFKDNTNIAMFYENILQNLPPYNMVEYIFFNKYINKDIDVNDASYSLYTSPSTIYRIINKFNNISRKRFNISINRSTLEFEGREMDIRSFFVQLFSEEYSYVQWPYKNVNRDCLYGFLTKLFDYLNYEVNYSDLEVVATIVAVNIERYKKGYEVEKIQINEMAKSILNKLNNDLEIKEELKPYTDTLGIELNKETLYNLFYIYLHKDFVYSFSYLLKNKIINSDISFSTYNILRIIYKLFLKYHIEIPHLGKFVVRIHNSAILYNKTVNSNYIIYDRNLFYVKNMSLKFPILIKDIQHAISEYLYNIKGKVELSELYYLTYIFITNWVNLIPEYSKNIKKIKVLVLSKSNYQHSESIKAQLDFYFGYVLETDLYKEKLIDLKKIEESDYNLILADFVLPRDFKKKCIYVNANQSFNNFMMLSKEINNLFQDNCC